MAHFRALNLLFLSILLLAPRASFAYSVQTHEGITDTVVKSYNKLHPGTFDTLASSAIVTGSSAEDDNWRFLNHFYDPIDGRGLTELGVPLGSPSVQWLTDTRGQASWRCIPGLSCSHAIKYEDKLFSSTTDYSWDRAIYEYVYGDPRRGLVSLGHVLHLLEDATVPAHVRNDQHASIGWIGDPDPYESYTSQFKTGSVPVPNLSSSIPEYSDPDAYLANVAAFTNTHFLSKDSDFGAYALPVKSNLAVDRDYLVDKTLNTAIAYLHEEKNFGSYNVQVKTLADPSDRVVSENWRILSREAVINGIGLVDLFFRSVEEEKKTHDIQKKNVSAAEEHSKELALKGFNIVKALYGSSLNQSDVADLLDEGSGNQAGAAALSMQVPPSSPPQKQVIAVQTVAKPTAATRAKSEQIPESKKAQASTTTEPKLVPSQTSSSISPGFGGGGSASQSSTANSPAPAFSVTSPSNGQLFATSSVTASGGASANAVVTVSFGMSQASTTADGTGAWILPMILGEGATQLNFSANKSDGSALGTSTVTVTVDTMAPSTPAPTASECSYSLVAGICVVASTTVHVVWSDIADATSYAVAVNGVLGATSTATTTSISISSDATSTLQVVAYDTAGNTATSVALAIRHFTQPLIINEIGWGGTDSHASDQWIEIKNISPFVIDLSHITLGRSGGASVTLSGTLNPNGFYVFQRSGTLLSGTAVLIPFDLLTTGSAEQLSLAWNTGGYVTVFDSSPTTGTCSTWCSGSLSATLGQNQAFGVLTAPLSMERISTNDGFSASSWQSNDGYGANTWGTVGTENSSGLPRSGVYCGSISNLVSADTSFNPGIGECVFLSRFVTPISNGGANRLGALYRGSVGSSTKLMSDLLSTLQKTENINFSQYSPQTGDQFFFAIWEHPTGPAFDNTSVDYNFYFTTASSTGALVTTPPYPAYNNYVVFPFTYQP